MLDIYMSEQTIVGFNSNDFFYVSAQENNIMPTDASCVTILSEADENKYTQDNGETIDYDFETGTFKFKCKHIININFTNFYRIEHYCINNITIDITWNILYNYHPG